MEEKRLRRRLGLLLIISTILVVLVAGISLVTAKVCNDNLKSASRDTISSELTRFESRLTLQNENDLNMLNTIAQEIVNTNDQDSDTFKNNLYSICQSNDFDHLRFIYKDGHYVSVEPGKIVTDVGYTNLNSSLVSDIDTSFSGDSKTSIYKDSGNYYYNYSVPVYKGEEIIGVIDGDILFSDFASNLNVSDIEEDVYITDLKSFNTVVKYYMDTDGIVDRIKKMNFSKDKTFITQNAEYNCYIGIESIDVNGWYICVVKSTSGMNANLYSMYRINVYAFVAFFFLVLLLLIIAYNYIKITSKQIIKIAYTDRLTGALTFSRFEKLVERRHEKNPYYTLIALNVRSFKFVNEMLGREEADKILRQIVKTAKAQTKQGELVCRDSADVFYLLVNDTNEDVIRNRLELAFEAFKTKLTNINYNIEFSCGVANNDGMHELYSVEQMLTNVMFALSQSKSLVSESICFFDSHVHSRQEFENYILSIFDKGLEEHQFEMYLQPKVDLNTNQIVAGEALCRWNLNDGTILSPGQFIPILEEYHLCNKLDFYMLEQAIRQIHTWQQAGIEPVHIACNQSRIVFYDDNYIARIHDLLEKYQVSGSWITLEILESTIIDDIDEFNKRVELVKKMGFSISLDDFGSGYSSLNVLAKLSIDELKIDQVFLNVNNYHENQKMKLILEAILHFAKELSISVVVEGVETKENHEFVKALGADIGQGYYYSRPLQVKDFNKIMEQ